MKNKLAAFSTCLVLLGMTGMAQATLTTIGTATYNGHPDLNLGQSDYNLIWDDDNNGHSVIWLDYTNPKNNWSLQTSWAAGLDADLTYNIDAAYSVNWDDAAWRLGSTVDGISQYGYEGTSTAGYNITSSEMGHLFYEELGRLGYRDTFGNIQSEYGSSQNDRQFYNLVPSWYWSGTEYTNIPGYAWAFYLGYNRPIGNGGYGDQGSGYQDWYYQGSLGYGLALRSGQVSVADPVPEPATILLLGTGIAGLAGGNRRRRKFWSIFRQTAV